MKFLCDRSRLEAALAPILPAIPVKDSPNQALLSLHIVAEEDRLVLQGSNLELSIETRIESVKVEEPGQCLVPARPFYQLLHELPDATVRVEVEGGKLVVPTSSGHFEIVAGNADDFPELEFDMEGVEVPMPVSLLSQHFHATEFAAAREATRYAMNGILFNGKDGKVTTVATDGRRLALIASPLESPDPVTDGSAGWQALLPQKSLLATVKALEGLAEDGDLALNISTNAVTFTIPSASISVRRLAGQFPDYDNVIPRETANTVEFERGAFEANLRRTAVTTDDLNPAVRITFEGSQARFESEATGIGSAKTVMDVNLSGPGGSIVFNPHFLADVLRISDAETLRLEFEDSSAPGKFVLAEEFVYIVMPITGL
ncbi:MAG: DNA polymerase III subunit beta [Planctomycetes bacterium]|jgi:DNA polymerase-3 subunit beta|nr:DNA polymerase III subunit beta [Planctomycetota bacterium]